MSFKISYKPFFSLNILHGYFLDKGVLPFDTLDAPTQASILQAYDARSFLSIKPSEETIRLLKGHHMVARSNKNGLTVGISAVEAAGKWKPELVPSSTLKLTFFLEVTDPLFYNYTNLPLYTHQNQVYYFSNQVVNDHGSSLHLSSPVKPFDSSRPYHAGDLHIDTSPTPPRLFEAVRYIPAGPYDPGDWREWPAPAFSSAESYVRGDTVLFNGNLYQASEDPAITVSPDPTEWDDLGAVPDLAFQFAHLEDRLPIRRGHIRDDVTQLSPAPGLTDIEVQVSKTSPKGVKEASATLTVPFSAATGQTLGEIGVDVSRLAPGLYTWEVINVGAPGNPPVSTPKSGVFYLHNQTEKPFGIVEIFLDRTNVDSSYWLLDANDNLVNNLPPATPPTTTPPTYTLQFKNRSTYWRYRLSEVQTLSNSGPLIPGATIASDIFVTKYPRPLTKTFADLKIKPNGTLISIPEPNVTLITPTKNAQTLDSYDLIFSEIFLRKF